VDPAYCAKVEALGAEGKSAPEIRRELGIPVSTWRAWVKKHPEFAESVEEADDAAQAWWIGLGRKGVLLGTNFSAQTFVYLTKNTTNELESAKTTGQCRHWPAVSRSPIMGKRFSLGW